ncbi:SAM-dependent methyltransferase, partial [Burkholderia cenocepacia]|nr:SAM-dependent methyltransferase [Burkholderia cenocepacia]
PAAVRQHRRDPLADSGWADVAIEPVERSCVLPEAALDDYVARLGPVGLALLETDEATRRRVIDTMRAA